MSFSDIGSKGRPHLAFYRGSPPEDDLVLVPAVIGPRTYHQGHTGD